MLAFFGHRFFLLSELSKFLLCGGYFLISSFSSGVSLSLVLSGKWRYFFWGRFFLILFWLLGFWNCFWSCLRLFFLFKWSDIILSGFYFHRLRCWNFWIYSFIFLEFSIHSRIHAILELFIKFCFSIRIMAHGSTSILIKDIWIKISHRGRGNDLNGLLIVILFFFLIDLFTFCFLFVIMMVMMLLRSSIKIRDYKINVVLRHSFNHLVHVDIKINWFVIIVILLNVTIKEVMSASLFDCLGVDDNTKRRQNIKILFHYSIFFLNYY